ncbi:Fic family protein [Candidatus Dependentiae bacterium]|nr:Fic family protein [Candidatus Dependentiae bacterium]
MRITGTYHTLGSIKSFIPHPLPPLDPPLELSSETLAGYGEASFSLGLLNEMSRRLPNHNRFIKAYVIKEALLSSAIEGIHTTLLDVFTHPLNESKPTKETQLVLNYTYSLERALSMLKEEHIPLGSRIILAAHESLMSGPAGTTTSGAGAFRKQSVQVGELVPAPAPYIHQLMTDLEKYIHEVDGLPALIKAGLVHVQFEMIHPFLDGNGRIGRLLIVLMLIENDLLQAPIFYPSYYFKKHHAEYYLRLDRVRTHGDYEGWINFYLKAIKASSMDAYYRAKEIEVLENQIKVLIQTDTSFLKMRQTALSTLDMIFHTPIFGVKELSEHLGMAYNTAHKSIMLFKKLGIITEKTEQKRNKLYSFTQYLSLLEKQY